MIPGVAAALGEVAGAGLDFWSSERNRKSQEEMNAQNIAMQREFAQNGIRWKVEDAKAAGLHPLAALGASTVGYSPTTNYVDQGAGFRSVGESVRRMGQNIDRAKAAAMTPVERQAQALEIRKRELENQVLDEQLKAAKLENARKVGPSMPSTVQYMMTPRGQIVVQPSNEFAAANASNIMNNMGWWIENKLIPNKGVEGMTQVIPGRYDPNFSYKDWGYVGPVNSW